MNRRTVSIAFLGLTLGLSASASDRIIGGEMVPTWAHPEVARIKTDNAGCSATAVGPRVLLTAAHCGETGATSKVTVDGEEVLGRFVRHPSYPGEDHDLALILLTDELENVRPATIGGHPKTGDKLLLVGYGCTQPGGGGGNDGNLYAGEADVTGFSNNDIVSRGAAVCFGDSGGPAYLSGDKGIVVTGIHSKGNVQNVSYHTQVATPKAFQFYKAFIQENGVEICGVNAVCDGSLSSRSGFEF